jgi:hypothetical protein
MSSLFGIASAGPAAGYSCDGVQYRAYDYQNHATAIGVTGQLTIPSQSDVHGYDVPPFYPTVGDVAVTNTGTKDFVQFGWYLGEPNGLLPATAPTLFFGEYSGNGNEQLVSNGVGLTWGASYSFKIVQTTTGGYRAYLNGAYEFSTSYAHGSVPTAETLGETGALCVTMDELAIRNPTPPDSTLYYASGSASSPTWTLFTDAITANSAVMAQPSGTFTFGKVNSDAGDFFALGGG